MTQTQAVALRPKDKVAEIDRALDERADALMAILPGSMDYARFRKVVTLAISKNPKLLECTPASIIRSVMEAAELGFEPTGLLGRAYLVPYRRNVAPKGRPAQYVQEAQLQIGYMGLVDLTLNSGRVRAAEARLVYEGDAFEVAFGTEPHVIHQPAFQTNDPSDIILAYAVLWYTDGTWDVEVMRKAEIDGIRARSRSANDGPWITDYGEMAKKTVLRRLAKRGPLTVEAIEAIGRDDEVEYAAPEPVVRRGSFIEKLRPVPEPTAELAPPSTESSEGAPTPATAPDAPPPEQVPAPAEEVIEGEVVKPRRTGPPRHRLCGAPSPYGDELTCTLVEKHLGLHRANEGRSSWDA